MILAWLGAVVIGLSLGLLGSGGSILTVPILGASSARRRRSLGRPQDPDTEAYVRGLRG